MGGKACKAKDIEPTKARDATATANAEPGAASKVVPVREDEPPQAVVQSKLRALGLTYKDFNKEYGPLVDAEKAYQELMAGIEEAEVKSRVVLKYIVVDLAFLDGHPLLKWLVARVAKPEAHTTLRTYYPYVPPGLELTSTYRKVGPHVLHWFDSSLVYVKEWHSEEAILALDIGELNLEFVEDRARLKKLATAMVEWNTKRVYNRHVSSCQHFVNEALVALGVEFDKKLGAVGKYLGKIRSGKRPAMTFRGVTFNTHEELDKYCWEHYEDLEDESEKALLKAFDRAFWLRDRHQENKKDPSLHEPALKEGKSKCFFDDPSVTGTAPKLMIRVPHELVQRYCCSPRMDLPPIRVLCLDGGGMRGVILIELIRRIEICLGARVDQVFDLIAGTSTGGILGSALAFRKVQSVDEAQQLYFELGEKVFGYQFGNLALGTIKVLRGKGYFQSQALKEIIKSYVGDEELTSLHKYAGPKAFVVSARKNKREGRREPFIFRSYPVYGDDDGGEEEDEEGQINCLPQEPTGSKSSGKEYYTGTINGRGIKLVDALLATSAAPYYLDCVTLDNDNFVDGGIVANNPTELALLEAIRLWPDRRISLISLGTGDVQSKEEKPASTRPSSSSSTLPKSIEPLIDIVSLATNSRMIDERVRALVTVLGKQQRGRFSLMRLNPPCPDYSLSACQKEVLAEMVKCTETYLASEQGQRHLAQACQSLGWPATQDA